MVPKEYIWPPLHLVTLCSQVTTRLKELGLADMDLRGGLPLGLLAPVEGLKHLNLSGNGLTR